MKIRSSRLSVFSALAFSLFLFAGCSGDDETEAISCESNEDCTPEEICEDGLCQSAECDPSCDEGLACVHAECICLNDDSCEAWELCQEGQCVIDPAAECMPDLDCDNGFACLDARCVCDSDRACEEGHVCDNAECRPATECETHSVCEAEDRVCMNGYCVEPCSSAADCGARSTNFACIEGICYRRCPLSESECGSGFICEQTEEGRICFEAQCSTLSDCEEAGKICTSEDHGRCIEVTYCQDETECEWTHNCKTPSPCPPGFDCDGGDQICIRRPYCVTDNDCNEGDTPGFCDMGYCFESTICSIEANDCPEGRHCIGGVCVPATCRGASDCEDGEICSGGVCITPDAGVPVDRVDILTPAGHIIQDEQRRLIAVAYDNTQQVIPGAAIEWTSSAPDTVSVDKDTGIITGGQEAGDATITASYGNENATVIWHLLEPIEAETVRVTVVDKSSGHPLARALVVLSTQKDELENVSDEDGVATFKISSDSGSINLHVFHDDNDYVSVFSVSGKDLVIPLPGRSDFTKAAGLTGQISHANVTSVGDLAIGLAGTSLGGALGDFDLQRLVGDMFVNQVPMIGSLPLPGGMTAKGEFQGFPIDVKSTYYARGEAGLRMSWAFAGRLDLDRFMDGGGGGGGQEGMSIAAMLPLFSFFEHGLQARISLADLPLIQDTNDINGNGNTTEMVPNWNSFPKRSHAPGQTQNLRLAVTTGSLPSLEGEPLKTVIFIGGARAPRIGLVPLGLSANDDSEGEGTVGLTRMRMAPVYGGLEVGDYQVIAMAVPESEGFDMPRKVSARVTTSFRLPEEVDFEDFLPFPEDTEWVRTSRTIFYSEVAGAGMLRSVVHGGDRSWHVYAPNLVSAEFSLPEVPETHDDLDRILEVTINPIQIKDGLDFESLMGIAGYGLIDLDSVTTAYSRMVF